jgi:hypothetical protein
VILWCRGERTLRGGGGFRPLKRTLHAVGGRVFGKRKRLRWRFGGAEVWVFEGFKTLTAALSRPRWRGWAKCEAGRGRERASGGRRRGVGGVRIGREWIGVS